MSDPKKSADKKPADKPAPDPKAGANPPDDSASNESEADCAYKPIGKVRVLGEAKRDGKTVRVLMDDKRVWKEVR